MRITRKTTSAAVAAVALAATVLTAAPASASGHTILRDGFEGNFPLTDPSATPVIGGVNPAGAPWILNDRSRVRVREDGRITISLRGLVLTRTGENPVPLVAASLVCGDMVVDSTDPFELSVPEGNGHLSTRIDVPDDCDDPVVLIRNANNPAGLGGYFAFTD
jgi:hypothetical protein